MNKMSPHIVSALKVLQTTAALEEMADVVRRELYEEWINCEDAEERETVFQKSQALDDVLYHLLSVADTKESNS